MVSRSIFPIAFNISQIEKALSAAQGRVDLLCFGEAFLQGFDSLSWDYETDKLAYGTEGILTVEV